MRTTNLKTWEMVKIMTEIPNIKVKIKNLDVWYDARDWEQRFMLKQLWEVKVPVIEKRVSITKRQIIDAVMGSFDFDNGLDENKLVRYLGLEEEEDECLG